MGSAVLAICLLAYQPPDEYAILYGNDMVWAQFSRYWEDDYDTSRSAFITTQGSHDMRHWYQDHRLKMELDFARIFTLRYRIEAKYDFEVSRQRHRVEPMINIAPGFRLHAFISPQFYKKDDEVGGGVSWTQAGRKNWIEAHTAIEHFDHNNILRHVSQGPKRDPYSRLPIRFALNARAELPWLKARLKGHVTTRSRQYLDWPDSTWAVWERFADHNGAWGRLELKPFEWVWLGSRFSWAYEGAETVWPAQDSVLVDTLKDGWVSPFVSISPSDRVQIYAEHRVWSYYRNMDSLRYRRDFDVTTFRVGWQPVNSVIFYTGFQYPWRERFINDSLIAEPWSGSNTWPRWMFNFEYRAPSGFKLVIKEGLRMWDFPAELFRRFHAHTYVQIYIPLCSFSPVEKRSQGNLGEPVLHTSTITQRSGVCN